MQKWLEKEFQRKEERIEKAIDLFQHNLFIQTNSNVMPYNKDEQKVFQAIQSDNLEFKENNFEATIENIAISKKPTWFIQLVLYVLSI